MLNRIRNRLLTGRETHPSGRSFAISRLDVNPGLEVSSEVVISITEGVPHIWKDSQLFEALTHPENFEWTTSGGSHVVRYRILKHTLTSYPYLKEKEWFAKTKFVDSNEETEVSLWDLGVVPDYVKRPKGNDWDPPGWNPLCSTTFGMSNLPRRRK